MATKAAASLELPPPDASMLDYALAYLERGYSVIPLRPKDKRPLIEWEAFQDRQPSTAEIEDWLTRWPDMNLGLVTGPISGVVALDIDGNDGRAALKESGLPHPSTLLQKTPHGWHAIYSLNGVPIRNKAGILPHVDIRGEGGYIVVAPSALPDGTYQWNSANAQITTAPSWMGAEADPSPRTAPADGEQPAWVSRYLREGASYGERNSTATRLAGYFHGRGLPDDVIAQVLAPFAAACQPPLDMHELMSTIRSVSRYTVRARALGIDEPPVFLDTGDGYRFEWQNGIRMELRGFRSANDGLHVELTILTELPGVRPKLHGPVRFNLLATQTRTTLVNYLDKQLSAPWASMLQEACDLANETYRAGEPSILLRDVIEPSGGVWAMPPLVLADGPTIWFADGGVGKSLLALGAALTLSGFPVLDIEPALRVRVAYLDWEWEPWWHKRRVRSLIGEEGLERCDIIYRRCYGSLVDQVDSLRSLIVAEGIGFVVVDSISAACGGEPESAAAAMAFADGLRRLKVGNLCLAHTTKSGANEYPFGSVMWHDMARLTWYIAKEQQPGSSVSHIGFYNRKANGTLISHPLGFQLTFDPSGDVGMAREDIRETPKLDSGRHATDRILDELKGGAMTRQELISALNVPQGSFDSAMARLQQRGLICQLERGLWGLPGVMHA